MSESEFSEVEQLLDPKWKGKIAMLDPRVPGPASTFNAYLMSLKGEDWLRKLLAQDLVVVSSGREEMQGLVRGRYTMALGVSHADLELFRREGLTANVKAIDPDNPAGRRLTSGIANVTLINRAPHPNAAKVFVNWLLSKGGQNAWVETLDENSCRLDVEGPAATAPKPGVTYDVEEREWSPLLPNTIRAMDIAKEMLK